MITQTMTVDHILEIKDAVFERIDTIAKLQKETDELLVAACDFAGQDSSIAPWFFQFDLKAGSGGMWVDLERVKHHINARLWDLFLKRSGVWSLMDGVARDEWKKVLDSPSLAVPLTRDNLISTLAKYYAEREKMLIRGITDLFFRLSKDHKTNSSVIFKKKIIAKYAFSKWYGRQISIDEKFANSIADLARICAIVNSEPEPDHRNIHKIIGRFNWSSLETASLDHFTIKPHLTGTAHIVFKTDETVKKLNDVIAKAYPSALPEHR